MIRLPCGLERSPCVQTASLAPRPATAAWCSDRPAKKFRCVLASNAPTSFYCLLVCRQVYYQNSKLIDESPEGTGIFRNPRQYCLRHWNHRLKLRQLAVALRIDLCHDIGQSKARSGERNSSRTLERENWDSQYGRYRAIECQRAGRRSTLLGRNLNIADDVRVSALLIAGVRRSGGIAVGSAIHDARVGVERARIQR